MNRPKSSRGQEEERGGLAEWRAATRDRLIAARRDLDPEDHRERSRRIAARLDGLLGDLHGRRIAVYWPLRGEPDLRPWVERARERGAIFALPVVVASGAPLVFRVWTPGMQLESGVWNIPVPAEGGEVIPEVVLVPLVGFDRRGYRLGYGGGYFDRTFATFAPKPLIVGVGFAFAELETIHPQPHDVPMDVIVTEEEGIVLGD